METINKIQEQIEAAQQKPKYVVLDTNTWSILRSNPSIREHISYGSEQSEPYSSDMICGLDVAIVTGHPGIVVKVVV